jgi:hypothetical protein
VTVTFRNFLVSFGSAARRRRAVALGAEGGGGGKSGGRRRGKKAGGKDGGRRRGKRAGGKAEGGGRGEKAKMVTDTFRNILVSFERKAVTSNFLLFFYKSCMQNEYLRPI